jgi:type IV pilus assembly protein PilC
VNGTIALTSESAVREHLRLSQLYLISLVEESAKEKVKAPLFRRNVKLQDLVVFSRQFASMVRAGVPIVQALDSLSEQTESPVLRNALVDVRRDVETGVSLSAAIGGRPQIFPEMFISLVKAGEVGGRLEESLEIAAVQFDKEADLREKVKSAFMYPAMVMGATGIVVTVMLVFIVPVFAKIYKDLHAELPAMTQLLVMMSHVLTHYTPWVILANVAVVWAIRYIYRTDKGRLWFDRLKLRLPVLGKLNRKVAVGRFVRTLSAMVASGLTLTRGLEVASGVAGNRVIADAGRGVVSELRKGQSLSSQLEQTGVFPRMVTQMVSVGEEAGSLEMMLSETANFYERDVEYTVKRLTSMLEPLLTAFLAVVVGFVVISLYMPIFGLGQAILGSK